MCSTFWSKVAGTNRHGSLSLNKLTMPPQPLCGTVGKSRARTSGQLQSAHTSAGAVWPCSDRTTTAWNGPVPRAIQEPLAVLGHWPTRLRNSDNLGAEIPSGTDRPAATLAYSASGKFVGAVVQLGSCDLHSQPR
jgi:hypothetical protein